MPDSRHSPDEEYKIEAFKIMSESNLAPEDDPAEWIYPDEEDADLRQLAEQIAKHDKVLARIQNWYMGFLKSAISQKHASEIHK